MPTKCDRCGELAVDESEQVCESCGGVFEDIEFRDEISRVTHSAFIPRTKFEKCIKKKKAVPVALSYGLSSLKNLCHVFNTHKKEPEAMNILNSAYKAKKFKQKEDFAVLAGCCLYLLQKNSNQFISLKEICSQLQCTRKKFSQMLTFLKSWSSANNVKFSSSDVDEEVDDETVDTDLPKEGESLIRAVFSNAPEAEKKELMTKTADLLRLANACWLFTGRSPRSVVVACAFLCWKSMHPHKKRSSFSRFCSEFKIREPIAKVRIPELKELLLKLGRKIPSYTPNYVNEDNFLFHLDTILENSETLRNDLLPDQFSSEAINCKEYSTFRIPVIKPPRQISKTAVTYAQDMNASDIEISDSEIQSYIREESQAKYIESLKETKN